MVAELEMQELLPRKGLVKDIWCPRLFARQFPLEDPSF